MSDERLKQLFASLNEELPAAEFKASVFRRIEHADRMRYVVLGAAAALGLAIAWGPLLDLLLLGMHELEMLMMTFIESDWTPSPMAVALALVLVITPGIVRWLER